MKLSKTIKMFACTSIFLANHAFAEQWVKVHRPEPTDSEMHEKLHKLGLSCDMLVSTFNGKSILGSCRQKQDTTWEIGFYSLTKIDDSYSTNLLFELDDASRTTWHEFHSPDTVANHLYSKSKDGADERVVLVDVQDEGACYSTEVFGLQGGMFRHLGSVEFFTIKYSIHLDTPGYVTNMECLGNYGYVQSAKGVRTIGFSVPKIYTLDSTSGHLAPLKRNKLKYRWPSSQLTRIK